MPWRRPLDTDHAAAFLHERGHLGAHPALEGGKRLRLPQERVEEDGLRHPDGVGILGRDPLEEELADLPAVQPHLARVEQRVGLSQHVLEQPQLVQEVGGAGLQHLAAELAIEVLMALQHQNVGASLGEEEAEHEAGRSAPHDADIHVWRRHVSSVPYSTERTSPPSTSMVVPVM